MYRKITNVIALMAIVAMVFAGITAATDPKVLASKDGSSYTDKHDGSQRSSSSSSILSIVGIRPIDEESVTLANLGNKPTELSGVSVNTDKGTTFVLPEIKLNPGEEVQINLFNSAGYSENLLDDSAGYASLVNSAGVQLSTIGYNNLLSNDGASAFNLQTTPTVQNNGFQSQSQCDAFRCVNAYATDST